MAAVRPAIERRIFVVGAPRSGTTLVQSLLAAHSGLTSFTESHFFDRHFTRMGGGGRALLTGDPRRRVEEFLAENGEAPIAAAERLARRRLLSVRPLAPLFTGPVAGELVALFDELALRRGRPGWVEKTPRHLGYLPWLERLCGSGGDAPDGAQRGPGPELRFVHVIRDGLQVVASLREASRSWERPYDLDECVERWNGDLALSLARLGSPADRFVVYEELTAAPEATLRPLLEGLGLAWEPQILERARRGAAGLLTPEEEGWKGNVAGPIRRSATAERTLTAEERARVEGGLRQDLYRRLRLAAGVLPPAPAKES